MITAKPLKRKGLGHASASKSTPRLRPIHGELSDETSKKHERNPTSEPEPIKYKTLDPKRFSKLVYGIIKGTGGIRASHCDQFVEQFRIKHGWKYYMGNKPNIYLILDKLVEEGKIDKVKIDGASYYFVIFSSIGEQDAESESSRIAG